MEKKYINLVFPFQCILLSQAAGSFVVGEVGQGGRLGHGLASWVTKFEYCC